MMLFVVVTGFLVYTVAEIPELLTIYLLKKQHNDVLRALDDEYDALFEEDDEY